MAVSPTATGPVPLAECTCRKVRHEHGTRNHYSYHLCRCDDCAAANNAYYADTANRRTTKRRWVDPGPARARIVLLREAGLTVAQIADMCAVTPTYMTTILYGVRGRPLTRILASTAEALEAIRAKDIAAVELTDDTRVDGAVPAIQTKALQACGWTVEDLEERSGVSIKTFYRLLRGHRTTEEMRRRIDALYRQLRFTSPEPSTELGHARLKRALRRAAENGWTPGMAEDGAYAQAA